ncbi:dual specificity protein phosphatase 18-like isoform 1-T2 [Rhinophrynus dorsalis]
MTQTKAGTSLRFKNKIMSLFGVSKITDGLYIGNAKAASNRMLLNVNSITCVINASLINAAAVSPVQDYMRIPVIDMPYATISKYFDAVADKIHQVEVSGGRTLLHCAAGVSRSATLCLAYLMKHTGRSLLEAHDWLKSCRPIIRPNIGFWKQLISYEMTLFGKNTVTIIDSPIGPIPDIYEEETKNMVPF